MSDKVIGCFAVLFRPITERHVRLLAAGGCSASAQLVAIMFPRREKAALSSGWR
jgi:hypothetical protein